MIKDIAVQYGYCAIKVGLKRGGMMKHIKIFILTIFLTLSPLVAQAHGVGGHHDASEFSQNEAIEYGAYRVSQLIEKGKIEKSWKLPKVISAEQKVYGHDIEWVVTFQNSKASDPAKSMLYIFLTANGKFIAANFTGE